MSGRRFPVLLCRGAALLVLMLLGSWSAAGAGAAGRPGVAAGPVKDRRIELAPFEGRGSQRSLPEGTTHVYHFDLEAGDFRDIRVNQEHLDVAVRVVNPEKQLLFQVDNLTGSTGIEQVPLLAERSGRYVVQATRSGPNAGIGTYQLIVRSKRRATHRDHQNAKGAIAYWQGKELERSRKTGAEDSYERALQEWTASGYLAGQADALFKIGKLRRDREEWRLSLAPMERAVGLYRRLGNRHQETVSLNGLGRAHQTMANYEAAVSFYEAALLLARRLREADSEADILYNLGRTNTELGRYEEALDQLEQALKIRGRGGNLLPMAKVLNGLGRLYCVLDDTDKAVFLHKQAMEIALRGPDSDLRAATLTHFADVYRRQNQNQKAISHYLEAIALTQHSGHVADPIALNNLALAYLQLQRYGEGLSALQHCAQVFERQGNTGSAAVAWANIGWVLTAMGRHKTAFDAYDRSLAMSRGKDLAGSQEAVYAGMAWAELRRQNLITARRWVEKGIALIESPRSRPQRAGLRRSYFASQQEVYELLVEILMEQHKREPTRGYDLKAFEASERARSRSLLDELEGKPVIPALSVKEIQDQILGNDTVLLEYFLGRERSFLWVVTGATFATRELAAPSRIRSQAQEVYRLLSVSNRLENRSETIRKATDLSRLLFGSLAKDIVGKKILIVAPPALQYISFGALPVIGGVQPGAESLWPAPWVSRQEIVVEPSATVLASLRRLHVGRREPPGLIAVFADPIYSRGDERVRFFPAFASGAEMPGPSRLQYSGREAAAILAQVQADKRLAAIGFDASRERALSGVLGGYRYLHFSVHGVLNSEEPELSALLLSIFDRNGRGVNGYLRAGEISTLRLPAELVVLSACRSGLGREVRGEGLVGLTQAFLVAGASRVLVSLWDVDDQATSKLMAQFYKSLFSGGLTPSAALKEAQEWMWKQPEWSAPVYWGGFVLEGEWQ